MWITLLLKQYHIKSLSPLFFSSNSSKCTFLKLSITTSNKFRFTLIFDITNSSLGALVHFAITILAFVVHQNQKKMQDCVSAYSKALNLHWTKKFGEGYVISKTKLKQNLLPVEIDYLIKVHFKLLLEKKREVQELT